MLSTALILSLQDLPGDVLIGAGVVAIGMALALVLGALMHKKRVGFNPLDSVSHLIQLSTSLSIRDF